MCKWFEDLWAYHVWRCRLVCYWFSSCWWWQPMGLLVWGSHYFTRGREQNADLVAMPSLYAGKPGWIFPGLWRFHGLPAEAGSVFPLGAVLRIAYGPEQLFWIFLCQLVNCVSGTRHLKNAGAMEPLFFSFLFFFLLNFILFLRGNKKIIKRKAAMSHGSREPTANADVASFFENKFIFFVAAWPELCMFLLDPFLLWIFYILSLWNPHSFVLWMEGRSTGGCLEYLP